MFQETPTRLHLRHPHSNNLCSVPVPQVVKKAMQAAKEFGGDGMDSWSVRSAMSMLNKQWPVAESLLLAQGKVGSYTPNS